MGGRYFSVTSDLSLSPENISPSVSKELGRAVRGGRYGATLSDKWRMRLTGNVGGFGIGSHLTWKATAVFWYPLDQTTYLGSAIGT